jgi:DNA-binding Xre family transcriptional regulator
MFTLRIRETAESKGYNLNRLQRETGMSMSQARRYWYNDTASVRLDAIDKICKLLDVTESDLFEYIPDED